MNTNGRKEELRTMADYTYECTECDIRFILDEYDFEEIPTCPKCGNTDVDIVRRGNLDGIVYNID